MSGIIRGYEEYFKYSDDPNLKRNSIFYLFDSFTAWDNDGGKDIPKNKIILRELKRNRFLAHP